MISYELALKLKEAGFPQKVMGKHVLPTNEILDYQQSNTYYLPTLKEVIEACNGNHRHFILEHHMGRLNGWSSQLGNVVTTIHRTPLEVVCQLYIALKNGK